MYVNNFLFVEIIGTQKSGHHITQTQTDMRQQNQVPIYSKFQIKSSVSLHIRNLK